MIECRISSSPLVPQGPSSLVFDPSALQSETNIPSQFIWSDEDKPSADLPELEIPPIDMGAFLSGDPVAVSEASKLVNEACKKHGFFLVVNHGVDTQLLAKAEEFMDSFFSMQLSEKNKVKRKLGEACGYASSFTERFSSNLPWKETLTLQYRLDSQSTNLEDYLSNALGEDFGRFGRAYQEYWDAMNSLALDIMELLATSLGIERNHFRDFFSGHDSSLLRLNNYPPCQKPDLTLGTGPHCDPTSLTILHQDQVGGLHVFVDQKWHSVPPNPGALVVNIGDTLKALTNGIYKSCLHRAAVNNRVVRRSIAFFLNPRGDKPVKPPTSLVNSENPRLYPDFTWSLFLEFTQKHYRSDMGTLDAFSSFLREQDSTNKLQ